MTEQTLKGSWKDLKGEIQNQWGKLTHDDLERTKGNLTSIAGLIEEKYGQAKEEISTKLHELSERFSHSAKKQSDDMKSTAAEGTEAIKKDLRQDKHQS